MDDDVRKRPLEESPDNSLRASELLTAPDVDAQTKPSKSQRKRQAHALQALGARFVELPRAHLARLALPDELYQAVLAMQGMRSHGARARQMQYIGKLMRQLDAAVLRTVWEALDPMHTIMPPPQP
jgi:ribosome-associated protein